MTKFLFFYIVFQVLAYIAVYLFTYVVGYFDLSQNWISIQAWIIQLFYLYVIEGAVTTLDMTTGVCLVVAGEIIQTLIMSCPSYTGPRFSTQQHMVNIIINTTGFGIGSLLRHLRDVGVFTWFT